MDSITFKATKNTKSKINDIYMLNDGNKFYIVKVEDITTETIYFKTINTGKTLAATTKQYSVYIKYAKNDPFDIIFEINKNYVVT
jgi:hypothetical protein